MSSSRRFLLDTNIVLHATRANSKISATIDAQFGLNASRFQPAISEVSIGELLAFTFSAHWGEKRKELLRAKISDTLVIPIGHPGIHARWAEIHSALRSAGVSIGQNDIWIAATASVAGMTLLTTDKDFSALKRVVGLDACILDSRTGLRE
jgi:predicted nucleic acid-binding protein